MIIKEGITTPTSNDVLLGRGAAVNNHIGNINFREMVKNKQEKYVTSITNIQKQIVTLEILQQIEGLNPPGRFIAQDSKTGLWHDVGIEKARKKIGQALRENAPAARKKKTVDPVRESLIYTDFTTRTSEDAYYDIRDAIENEMSKKDSALRKQLQLSYNQMHCKNDSAKENTESNMTFSMEVSIPEVKKFLNEHRSGKIKQDLDASMVDIDSIGTFSIGEMSLSISSELSLSSDKLETIMVSFRLDMM